MTLNELLKRYLIFTLAVFIMGFSIGTITNAQLGVTPISSLNYVFSVHTPFSLGLTTFIFNIILIILEIFLEERLNHRKIIGIIAQFPICIIFSIAIDLGLYILNHIMPDDKSYFIALIELAIGIVFLSLGVTLQVIANVLMVPGEAVVKSIATRLNKPFGYIKIAFDCSLVIAAIITSLIYTSFSYVDGIREGTVICALLTGMLVKYLLPFFMKLSKKILPSQP